VGAPVAPRAQNQDGGGQPALPAVAGAAGPPPPGSTRGASLRGVIAAAAAQGASAAAALEARIPTIVPGRYRTAQARAKRELAALALRGGHGREVRAAAPAARAAADQRPAEPGPLTGRSHGDDAIESPSPDDDGVAASAAAAAAAADGGEGGARRAGRVGPEPRRPWASAQGGGGLQATQQPAGPPADTSPLRPRSAKRARALADAAKTIADGLEGDLLEEEAQEGAAGDGLLGGAAATQLA
jgi:hypothetical protein